MFTTKNHWKRKILESFSKQKPSHKKCWKCFVKLVKGFKAEIFIKHGEKEKKDSKNFFRIELIHQDDGQNCNRTSMIREVC